MSDFNPMGMMDTLTPPPAPERPVQPGRQMDPKKVRQMYDRAMRATREIRQQAAINEQFILANHWLRWNRAVERLEERPRDPARVRVTVNRLGPDSHRLLSKLTSRDLAWDCRPRSADDMAIQSARTAEQALYETARDQSWEDIRYDHALDTWQGGVAGIMVEWDDQAGTPLEVDEMGRTIGTGDVRLTNVPIHEIGVEPGTRNAELGLWWIHARALPPPEVRETFNMAREPKPDAKPMDTTWSVAKSDDTTHTPMCMVYTYYERPTAKNPQGQIVTVVGDEIVDQSPWYFPFTDRLNLAVCRVQPVSRKWYGHTPVTDAIPVQTGINAAWSSILEHLKLAGNARTWIPEGSVDNVEDLTDRPGEFAEFNAVNGQRPFTEGPPAMPDWWIRSPEKLGMALDDILGQHDISRGVAPSGVESGIAMSLLSENDDTPIGRFIKSMASMWGRIGSMVLEIYEQKVLESREARVFMPNSRIPEVIKWNGSSLEGHTKVTVPLDAVIPRNRNAQAAYAFQLNDRGLVTDPVQLAKIGDLPDQDDLIEGMDPDTARAMRENSHMGAGQARTVDVIDDHRNHLKHHRDFMRSQRFENLPVDYQELVRMHNAAHELYAAGIMAEQSTAASVSPIAAALPTEAANTINPDDLAQAAMLSEFAPSAETAMAPGGPPDLGMMEAGMEAGMPEGPPGQGTPPADVGALAPENPQQMAQPLLEEGPPG